MYFVLVIEKEVNFNVKIDTYFFQKHFSSRPTRKYVNRFTHFNRTLDWQLENRTCRDDWKYHQPHNRTSFQLY